MPTPNNGQAAARAEMVEAARRLAASLKQGLDTYVDKLEHGPVDGIDAQFELVMVGWSALAVGSMQYHGLVIRRETDDIVATNQVDDARAELTRLAAGMTQFVDVCAAAYRAKDPELMLEREILYPRFDEGTNLRNLFGGGDRG